MGTDPDTWWGGSLRGTPRAAPPAERSSLSAAPPYSGLKASPGPEPPRPTRALRPNSFQASVTDPRLPPPTWAPPRFPGARRPTPLRPRCARGQMRPRESEAPRPRAYPPSSFPTPLRRTTRPLPAPIPPETLEVGRLRGSPRRSVPRFRGQGAQRGHEGAQRPQGAWGGRQSAFLLMGPAGPHPGTAFKDRSGRREQERGPVGKRGLGA